MNVLCTLLPTMGLCALHMRKECIIKKKQMMLRCTCWTIPIINLISAKVVKLKFPPEPQDIQHLSPQAEKDHELVERHL